MVNRVFGIWVRNNKEYHQILVRSSPYFTFANSTFKWQEAREWECKGILPEERGWTLLVDSDLTVW